MAKKKASEVESSVLLEDSKQQASIVDLNQITKAATEMITIKLRLAKWQEEAKKLSDRFRELQEQIVPDLMFKAGMSEFTLTGGVKLIIDDILSGSIPSRSSIEDCDDSFERQKLEHRRKEAFAWLRKNKAKDLIKATLKAEFSAGDGALAIKYAKEIGKLGYKVSTDENVHPQTLNKFLREKVQSGAEVPADIFAIFSGKRATLKPPAAQK